MGGDIASDSGGTDVGWLPVGPIVDIITNYAVPIAVTKSVVTQTGHACAGTIWSRLVHDTVELEPPEAEALPVLGQQYFLFVELNSDSLRRFNLATGQVHALVDPSRPWTQLASATAVTFSGSDQPANWRSPQAMCVNASDNSILVLETDTWDTDGDMYGGFAHWVRRIDGVTGIVSLVCGGTERGYRDGVGADARFNGPCSIDVSSDGTFAVLSELTGCRLRQIALATGTVTCLAGDGSPNNRDGPSTKSQLHEPQSIAFDRSGHSKHDSRVYVATNLSQSVQHLELSTGQLGTLWFTCRPCVGRPRAVHSFAVLKDQLLIAGDKQLFVHNLSNGATEPFEASSGSVPSGVAIRADLTGNGNDEMFVCTRDQGVLRFAGSVIHVLNSMSAVAFELPEYLM